MNFECQTHTSGLSRQCITPPLIKVLLAQWLLEISRRYWPCSLWKSIVPEVFHLSPGFVLHPGVNCVTQGKQHYVWSGELWRYQNLFIGLLLTGFRQKPPDWNIRLEGSINIAPLGCFGSCLCEVFQNHGNHKSTARPLWEAVREVTSQLPVCTHKLLRPSALRMLVDRHQTDIRK